MRARLDEAAVAEWQRLMAEWDGTSRELDKARTAAAAARDDVTHSAHDATIARLTARLQFLQGGIDALIKQTQSVRDPQRQDLLVATIKRGMVATEQAGDKPATPHQLTARSK